MAKEVDGSKDNGWLRWRLALLLSLPSTVSVQAAPLAPRAYVLWGNLAPPGLAEAGHRAPLTRGRTVGM